MADPVTIIAIAGLIISAIGTGASIKAQEDAKRAAAKTAALQKKEARIQKSIAAVKARRAARVRKAQIVASGGGAGISGSIFEGSQTALQSSLESQVGLLESQADIQAEQFDIAADVSVTQANANIASDLGTFAATTIKSDVVQDLFTPTKATE